MQSVNFLTAGNTTALQVAANTLKAHGCLFSNIPSQAVTHLLLPVPSFDTDGRIKGGGSLEDLLSRLSPNVTIIGGNLNETELTQYRTIDLLTDPLYLSENASITAYCAMTLAAVNLQITFKKLSVLVIGWGRIGKCLSNLLKQVGCHVTIAARKESDRATLSALGYTAIHTDEISPDTYRLIFNTVPVMLIENAPEGPLYIDLASKPGIRGSNVLWARGLPNKDAPESSGKLIADTVLRHIFKEEVKI